MSNIFRLIERSATREMVKRMAADCVAQLEETSRRQKAETPVLAKRYEPAMDGPITPEMRAWLARQSE